MKNKSKKSGVICKSSKNAILIKASKCLYIK